MYYNFVLLLISHLVLASVISTNTFQNKGSKDDRVHIDNSKYLESINIKRDTSDVKRDPNQNDVWDIFINGSTESIPNLGLNAHISPYNPNQFTWNLIKKNLNDVEQKIMQRPNHDQGKSLEKCNTNHEAKQGI